MDRYKDNKAITNQEAILLEILSTLDKILERTTPNGEMQIEVVKPVTIPSETVKPKSKK